MLNQKKNLNQKKKPESKIEPEAKKEPESKKEPEPESKRKHESKVSATRRALHFVFKIGDRTKTASFYRDILGMKTLRHEEFQKGCAATCNGPYDGKWSKSMVGYGHENNHFVVELTYNYGIGSYKHGNDFKGITIHSNDVLKRIQATGYPSKQEGNTTHIKCPDGYQFHILPSTESSDPVKKVTLASSNLEKTVDYWTRLLEMKVYNRTNNAVVLGYEDNQCQLEFVKIDEEIERAKAFGRIAFSCPASQLKLIQKTMEQEKQTVLTPLVSLATPGKITVEVVILADPDNHEICFVGDEGFRGLSQIDPESDAKLDEAMDKDKSNEWFEMEGKKKAQKE